MKIDHERCSELLGPFLRGELESEAHHEVEDHLTSCRDCSEELAALRHLISAPEPEPLSELESARLGRNVWAALRPEAPAQPRAWGARLAPYLGTAAVLALFAVGVFAINSGQGDDDSGADMSVAESEVDSGTSGGGARTADEEALTNESSAVLEDEDGQDTATAYSSPQPFYAGEAGNFTGGQLDSLGSQGQPFVDFSMNYSTSDAGALGEDFLDQLASQAADPAVFESCARSALEALGSDALIAYGASGTYRSAPAVFVGFVTGSTGNGLGRYSIWVFDPQDCSTQVDVRNGPISP